MEVKQSWVLTWLLGDPKKVFSDLDFANDIALLLDDISGAETALKKDHPCYRL